MKEDKIIINGQEYCLGFNLRSRVIFERIAGKAIDDNMGTFDNIVFFFSILLAFNKDTFRMTFDEFFNFLNENEEVYADLLSWVNSYYQRKLELLEPKESDNDTDKKKE